MWIGQGENIRDYIWVFLTFFILSQEDLVLFSFCFGLVGFVDRENT